MPGLKKEIVSEVSNTKDKQLSCHFALQEVQSRHFFHNPLPYRLN